MKEQRGHSWQQSWSIEEECVSRPTRSSVAKQGTLLKGWCSPCRRLEARRISRKVLSFRHLTLKTAWRMGWRDKTVFCSAIAIKWWQGRDKSGYLGGGTPKSLDIYQGRELREWEQSEHNLPSSSVIQGTHTHTYMHTHVYTHAHMYTHMHTCTHIYTQHIWWGWGVYFRCCMLRLL